MLSFIKQLSADFWEEFLESHFNAQVQSVFADDAFRFILDDDSAEAD